MLRIFGISTGPYPYAAESIRSLRKLRLHPAIGTAAAGRGRGGLVGRRGPPGDSARGGAGFGGVLRDTTDIL